MTCEGKFCTLEASRLTWRAEREMAGSATEATLKATGILGNLSKMGTWKKDHRKPGEREKKCELLESGEQREIFGPWMFCEGPTLGIDRISGRQRFMGRVLIKERLGVKIAGQRTGWSTGSLGSV